MSSASTKVPLWGEDISFEDDGLCILPSRSDSWTEWKLEFLRRNYHKLTERRLGERLGHLPQTVREKAIALGLRSAEPEKPPPFSLYTPLSSASLAYMLAAMFGDGTITDRSLWLEVRDKEFAEQVARCLSHVLGQPITPYATEDGWFGVRKSAPALVRWIRGCTIADLWHILGGYAAEYLAGFYDAEGYGGYSLSGGPRRCSLSINMGMCNTNPMLILLARRFMLDLGIWHTVQRTGWSVRDFSKKNYVSIGKPMYLLSLTKRASVLRFIDLVPVRIARKRKTLVNLAQEIAARTPFAV